MPSRSGKGVYKESKYLIKDAGLGYFNVEALDLFTLCFYQCICLPPDL
jgi:hypothetical protein